MAHALAIVVGDDWEALMQPHCIHQKDGTEGNGQFDWCERGGRFGKPLKFRVPQSRGGLLRFLGATTHTAQGGRLPFVNVPARVRANRTLHWTGAMTILEAGIIAGAPVGAAVGGMLGRSHDTLATVGVATGGLMAGAAAGWLFAVLLIVLISVINVFWRAVRKRPPDPPSESDMEIMNSLAVRGTFVSAVASAVVYTESGWLPALVTLTMSAFITAFLSVARCELRRAE